MSFTYNRDIPDAPNNPSADQPDMKINTNSIDDLIAVDHVSFNTLNGGYHTVIHQGPFDNNTWDPVAQTGAPAAIPLINQLFSLNYTTDTSATTTDTQLFAESGDGEILQLTGKDTTNSSDGWCWAGGVLLQWGGVSFSPGQQHISGTVTFKNRVTGAIPFPNTCFNVVAVLSINDSSVTTASNTLAIRSISNTQFRYVYNGNSSASSDYNGFYWFAVGN